MTETRVVPTGKVYRQKFEAQAHLSLSLHEERRRRAARASCLSGDNPISSNTDNGFGQFSQTGVEKCSEDMTRNQLFSGTKPVFRADMTVHEEISGLPDHVVSENNSSGIIERLKKKKQREHFEALSQLQKDLAELTVAYESILRDTGEEFLLKMFEYDEVVERLMQKTEQDLEGFSSQDLHEIWNSVSQESAMRRNCIWELDELLVKYELNRAAMLAGVLRKYTVKLEKISYVMPSDVHRLINNEAMMINQALLANRRAVAKLHLNLMEKDLQKEVLSHLRWETKFQDWKKFNLVATVSQFKDFMNSPEICTPKSVQDILNSMRTKQKVYSEQRLKILQQVRNMTPPNCSKSSAAEWFSSLSSINKEIDSLHTETLSKLNGNFENVWQNCFLKVEEFKSEISTYGLTSDEIQDFVNREMVPLISKCQNLAWEHLATVEKAFEGLAKTAAFLSQLLFEFVHGAANIWEVHCASLQCTEQRLQDYLEEVSKRYKEKGQKKEAELDVMMDKLRQESTKGSLKVALEKTLNFLEEIKEGCVSFYKEGVETVERYPVMVLKETHAYSIAVSRYFSVNEIYRQDPEEIQMRYPSLITGVSHISCIKSPSVNPCSDDLWSVSLQAHTPDLAHTEENINFSQKLRDPQNTETFTTVKGNVYGCPVLQFDDADECLNVVEVETVLYPKNLIIELQRDMREKFFNHLEQRNQEVLDHTIGIMESKKEKLKYELDLHLHLHQPRATRIEMDIHNVRAAELILHRDCVERHCKDILQSLAHFRNDLNSLQVTHRKMKDDFCAKISSMEDTLHTATKSYMLEKLSASLKTSFTEHMNNIQELQRQFIHNMEISFEGLREANSQFLKDFKLFAEGGNFSMKEIEQYRKCLQKMAKRIDSANESLLLDIDSTETQCLDQAKEVISKFEVKLQFLKVDLMFVEKIQRVLSNTQVRIKSEAMKSNTQKKMINTVMSELNDRLDAYTHCRVTSSDIFGLTSSLIEELRKRSQYLDCYLDPSMAVPLPDAPLQGAFAVAARPRSRKQKAGSPAVDLLLQPSHMGAAFIDDKAVELIKGLQRIGKPQTCHELNAGLKKINSTTGAAPIKQSSPPGSGHKSGKNVNLSRLPSLHRKSAESINSQSDKRSCKSRHFNLSFQVFGPKLDVQQEIITYKGLITNILWEANELLLKVAEDFYRKKKRRVVSRPQYIQKSFELCAEDLNKRLLVCQKQSHEYHHACVQEFCQQLKTTEGIVHKMPETLLTKLSNHHSECLSQSLALVRLQFEQTWQQSEQKKTEHSSQLYLYLGHPACEEELNRLIIAENQRQEEQREAIENNRLELQACIKKNADAFVTALGTMTEKLLLQLDNILTVDEIQGGPVEPKWENIIKFVQQTQADSSQEECEKRPVPGSRMWSGIRYFGTIDGSQIKQQNRRTATITTAKTTAAQLKVIEVRNSLHQSYEQRIMGEFGCVEKSKQEQETELFHWQEYWRGELKTLSTLNSE